MDNLEKTNQLLESIERMLATKLLQGNNPKFQIIRVALIRQLSAIEHYEAHVRDGLNGDEYLKLAAKYNRIASNLLKG